MKTQPRHLFLRHFRKGVFLFVDLMIQKKTRSTKKRPFGMFKKNENKKHKYSASKF